MNFYDSIQLIGGLMLSIGSLPQIYRICKTKSVKDLSLQTNLYVMIAILLFEINLFHMVLTTGVGLTFLITNTMSLVVAITMVLLISSYRIKVTNKKSEAERRKIERRKVERRLFNDEEDFG